MKYEIDKDWLYEQYIVQKKSLNEIARIVGCKQNNTIRQNLIRYSIKVRTVSEGLRVNNPSLTINHDIIDGCLLGDAGLQIYNRNSSDSFPTFYKKNKFLEHIQYVIKFFYDDYHRITEEFEPKYNRTYYRFATLADPLLLKYYKRWYPEGKKVLPIDCSIEPLSLLNWFMDDGSTSTCKRYRIQDVRLTLSSQCFAKEDQKILSDRINNRYGHICYIGKCSTGTGFFIRVRDSKVNDFLDIIGQSPIKCMEYKWKRRYRIDSLGLI